MENILEIYAKEICSNCKNREKCQEELHIRIDRTVRCEEYVKDKQCKGYERPIGKTAPLQKTVMGLSSSDWS